MYVPLLNCSIKVAIELVSGSLLANYLHFSPMDMWCSVFLARARCLSAGLRYLRLTRLPRHDRGPVPRGNRSAASCLCTVLRRALYHYATRSPDGHVVQCMEPCLSKDLLESGKTTIFFSVQRLIATTVNFKK